MVLCLVFVFSKRITSIQLLDHSDITYSTSERTIWSILEPTLGMVNYCMLVTRPALRLELDTQ